MTRETTTWVPAVPGGAADAMVTRLLHDPDQLEANREQFPDRFGWVTDDMLAVLRDDPMLDSLFGDLAEVEAEISSYDATLGGVPGGVVSHQLEAVATMINRRRAKLITEHAGAAPDPISVRLNTVGYLLATELIDAADQPGRRDEIARWWAKHAKGVGNLVGDILRRPHLFENERAACRGYFVKQGLPIPNVDELIAYRARTTLDERRLADRIQDGASTGSAIIDALADDPTRGSWSRP